MAFLNSGCVNCKAWLLMIAGDGPSCLYLNTILFDATSLIYGVLLDQTMTWQDLMNPWVGHLKQQHDTFSANSKYFNRGI